MDPTTPPTALAPPAANDDQAFLDAYNRMATSGQPDQDPVVAQYEKHLQEQGTAQDAAAAGVDPSQLKGDGWDQMRPNVTPEAQSFLWKHRGTENFIGRMGHSIARGGIEAYNAVNRTGSILALRAGDALGLIGNTPGERATLQHYYDPHVPADQKQFATTVSPETMDKIAPAQGGLYGILQGLTEFGAEFALTGALGKAAGGALGALGKAAGSGEAVAKLGNAASKLNTMGLMQGAATQVLFQDPYASRVSNLLAEAPPQFSSPWASWLNAPIKAIGPYADVLKADPLDSIGLAQAKSVTEGMLLGMPFAVAGHVLGAVHIKLARAVDEGAITETQSKTLLEEAHRDYADAIAKGQAKMDDPAEPTKIVDLPNGEKQVVLRAAPPPAPAAPAETPAAPALADAAHGQKLRASMKGLYKPGEDVTVPDSGIRRPDPVVSPTPTEAAPAPAAPAVETPATPDIPGPTFATDLEAQNAKAAIDDHFAAARAAREPLKPEDIATMQAKVKAMGPTPTEEDMANLLETHGINGRYLTSPDDAVNMLKAVVDVRPEDMQALRNKPQGWQETLATAQAMFPEGSFTAQKIKPILERMGLSLEKAPAVFTAARAFIRLQAREVRKLSMLVDMYPGNGALENHLLDAVNALHGVHAEFVGANASVGRTLQVNQMDSQLLEKEFSSPRPGNPEPTAGAPKAESAAKPPLDRQEAIDLAHLIATAAPEDVEGMLKLISGPTRAEIDAASPKVKPSLIQRALGLRVEGLLSSPTTQVVNTISNSMRLFTNPAETALAGARDVINGAGPETLHQAWDLFTGQLLAFRDSVKYASKAFMEGKPILDPGNFIPEKANYQGPGELGQGITESPWSAVKQLVKLPGRSMLGTDEFFTQALYRSRARMEILADLRAKVADGTIKTDADLQALAQRRIDAAVDDGGRGIYKPALDYARDGTYKTNLTGFPKIFQQLVNSNPATRFLFPFVRTPYNIFDYTWQLTPGLNNFNSRMQAALEAGGTGAKEAISRSQMGTALYGLAAYLAASGKITGSGPTDPKVYKTWRQFNQPDSLKLDDGTFVSFKRGDTLFTPLAIMADLWSASGNMQDSDRTSMAAALAATFSANALNHSYLSNLDAMFDALGSKGDGQKVQKFLANAIGSASPAILHDAVKATDPYERELQGLWDTLKERVPGFSKTLEPKMNVFGEPVLRPSGFVNETMNPFTVYKPQGDQYVNSELDKLGRNLPDLPQMKDGVDLTNRELYGQDGKSPFTRWHELMGQPSPGSPALRDELAKIINDPSWKKMTGDGAYTEGGQKYSVVAKLMDGYRQAGWGRLLEENPQLKQAWEGQTQIKAAGLAGGRPAATAKANELRGLSKLIQH